MATNTKTANKPTLNEKYSPEYKKKVQTLLKEEGFFKGDITGNYLHSILNQL